jgi:hypothetical protein
MLRIGYIHRGERERINIQGTGSEYGFFVSNSVYSIIARRTRIWLN